MSDGDDEYTEHWFMVAHFDHRGDRTTVHAPGDPYTILCRSCDYDRQVTPLTGTVIPVRCPTCGRPCECGRELDEALQ
jgi:hypothetical protein